MEGMLSPYRVLDLTDEKGLLCGKLLGDLGADVIKIEKPGGDKARSLGPFYNDDPNPERSLFWFAYNTSKRGITLNLDTADGREIFKRLVKNTDFVVESFPLGYMDSVGLGYSELEKLNPGVIMVSITPFGQTGPYKDFKSSDIVSWALGGKMYPVGDVDRAPVRIGHHSQAYLHAAIDGAVGAMIAQYQRKITGEGQHVDVSVQDSLPISIYGATAFWDMMKQLVIRGKLFGDLNIRIKQMWPCKDGYVVWIFTAGQAGMILNGPLINWMRDEGAYDEFLMNFDWSKHFYETATQDTIDRLEAPAAKFFLARTTQELLEGAVKYSACLYPAATTKDLLEDTQLAYRKFWVEVPHPELNTSITYPGGFAPSTEVSPRISRRAPLIGEHNAEIFEKELGFSTKELASLKELGVI